MRLSGLCTSLLLLLSLPFRVVFGTLRDVLELERQERALGKVFPKKSGGTERSGWMVIVITAIVFAGVLAVVGVIAFRLGWIDFPSESEIECIRRTDEGYDPEDV